MKIFDLYKLNIFYIICTGLITTKGGKRRVRKGGRERGSEGGGRQGGGGGKLFHTKLKI